MQNPLILISLATALILGTSSPLWAQAPPAATSPNPTNEPTLTGVIASPVVFEWRSGTLVGFVAQIKEVFGIDLRHRADIPGQMLNTRVPSMKIKTDRVWDVLVLYDQISSDYPQIGRWVWHYPGDEALVFAGRRLKEGVEPSAIYLVPPKQPDTEESLSVRAFSLRGISSEEQKLLFELINDERRRLQSREAERGIKSSQFEDDVHIHEKTGICVATGSRTYVEMVGSVIDAFQHGRSRGPYPVKPQDEK